MSTDLTSERLAEMRAVAEAATPGEWDSVPAGAWTGRVFAGEDIVAKVPTDQSDDHSNADHIATFDPPTVLALIGEVERLRTALAERDAVIERVRELADEWEASTEVEWPKRGHRRTILACRETHARLIHAAIEGDGGER